MDKQKITISRIETQLKKEGLRLYPIKRLFYDYTLMKEGYKVFDIAKEELKNSFELWLDFCTEFKDTPFIEYLKIHLSITQDIKEVLK